MKKIKFSLQNNDSIGLCTLQVILLSISVFWSLSEKNYETNWNQQGRKEDQSFLNFDINIV